MNPRQLRRATHSIGPRENRVLRSLVLSLLLPLLIIGCGSETAEDVSVRSAPSREADELPETPPADYLRQVLSRYRNARSYRDRGEVHLRVEKDGRLTRHTAPMQVALDGSTLWVSAYDARLWSDDEETIGWLADEQSGFHDSQVLVAGSAATRRATERPVLERLLGDPVLTARMTAGLGGPPPQLEWLLDADPMAKLFPNSADANRAGGQERTIRYDGFASRDGVRCLIVEATAGKETYRFWIEPSRSLIHRVELPIVQAGMPVELEGWKVRSLELVLGGASFQPPDSPYRLSEMDGAELPPRPKYVRALVPLPPPAPHDRIGATAGGFELPDVTGNHRVTEAGAGQELTLWYFADPGPVPSDQQRVVQSFGTLSAALRQMDPALSSRLGVIAAADETTSRLLIDVGITGGRWILLTDGESMIRRRFGLEQGRFALADSRGRIVWVGSDADPSQLAELAAVATDVLSGVDVPSQLRRIWEADVRAYRKRVAELTVR